MPSIHESNKMPNKRKQIRLDQRYYIHFEEFKVIRECYYF